MIVLGYVNVDSVYFFSIRGVTQMILKMEVQLPVLCQCFSSWKKIQLRCWN